MLFADKLPMESRLVAVALVLLASIALVLMGFDRAISGFLLGFGFPGALVAGAFYTLGATTPFAMVVIIELMKMENPLHVAAFACFSAATVDCILFWLVRDGLEKSTRKVMADLHSTFRKFAPAFPFAGFFVFGLPLPDEIGLALMQISEIRLLKLWFVVFFAKFITLMLVWKALSP